MVAVSAFGEEAIACSVAEHSQRRTTPSAGHHCVG